LETVVHPTKHSGFIKQNRMSENQD
jgi:hypothetical protein